MRNAFCGKRIVLFRSILFIAVSAAICHGQNIQINGTVMDSDSVPIAGAEVILEKCGVQTVTDENGDFNISATQIHIHNPEKKVDGLTAGIRNNQLTLSLAERSCVEVTAYNLRGVQIYSMKKNLPAGIQTIHQPQTAAGVYIFTIAVNSEKLAVKCITPLSIGQHTASFQSQPDISTLSFNAQNKKQFDDILSVSKDGYLQDRLLIKETDISDMDIFLIKFAGTVTDIDGNLYHTLIFNRLEWTVENLKTTRYNDGTPIPHLKDSALWANDTIGAYCYFNNDSAGNGEKYGGLYNWHAVKTEKLAPEGWHVPSATEYWILETYLNTNGFTWDGDTSSHKIAKSLASKADWDSTSAAKEGTIGHTRNLNNRSGFSALPGSVRNNDGSFKNNPGTVGMWWTSYMNPQLPLPQARSLNLVMPTIRYNGLKPEYGLSVRLVKDW